MTTRRVFSWIACALTLFCGWGTFMMLTSPSGRGEVSAIIDGPLTVLFMGGTFVFALTTWGLAGATSQAWRDGLGVCAVIGVGLAINAAVWAWYERGQIAQLEALVVSNLARIETDGRTVDGLRDLQQEFRLDARRLSITDGDSRLALEQSFNVPARYYNDIILGNDANALDPFDLYKPYCDAFKTQFAATYVPAEHDARFDKHCPAEYPPRD